jgi:ribosome-associated toxin RatA of RatAB toxin-antitoxin module
MQEHMRKSLRHFTFATAAALASGPAFCDDPAQQESIVVDVQTRGDGLVIVAGFSVQATPSEVWKVLTDYDRMSDFLPNLNYSKRLDGPDDKFQVEQKGKVFWGPFSFSYDFVREVVQTPPQEIQSRLISGNFRQLDGETRLIPFGEGTYIAYWGEATPVVPLPQGLSAAITKRAIREQFEYMKREILRRKNGEGK